MIVLLHEQKRAFIKKKISQSYLLSVHTIQGNYYVVIKLIFFKFKNNLSFSIFIAHIQQMRHSHSHLSEHVIIILKLKNPSGITNSHKN